MRYAWGIIIVAICLFALLSCATNTSEEFDVFAEAEAESHATPKVEEKEEEAEEPGIIDSFLSGGGSTPTSYEGYPLFTHMMGYWSTTNYFVMYEVTWESEAGTKKYSINEKKGPGKMQIEIMNDDGSKEYYFLVESELFSCDSVSATATCTTVEYSEVISAGILFEFTEVEKIDDFEEVDVLDQKALCGYGFKTVPCLTREGLPLKAIYEEGGNKYTFVATSYEFPYDEEIELPSSIS